MQIVRFRSQQHLQSGRWIVARKGRARRFREARQLKQGYDDGMFSESPNKSLADAVEDNLDDDVDDDDDWDDEEDDDEYDPLDH